ncbi:MAG TPA: hypothetical protein VNN77_18385 [candidate division Zixibacteria bacterium]|nr:hypothetical protein [candidate division Zixibacteria bacterium]
MAENPAAAPVSIDTKSIADQIARDTKVHMNLGQDAIVITEDRVRLVLMTHLRKLEQKRGWIAPLGLLVAIVTAFATATFRDAFGLKATTWEAIFVLSGVASLVWTIIAMVIAVRAPSVDDVVSEMKREAKAIAEKDA